MWNSLHFELRKFLGTQKFADLFSERIVFENQIKFSLRNVNGSRKYQKHQKKKSKTSKIQKDIWGRDVTQQKKKNFICNSVKCILLKFYEYFGISNEFST